MIKGMEKVTRFEVIDDNGRALVKYNVRVQLSLQDGGRTLKVFLRDTDAPAAQVHSLEGQ